jgi:hypothetical protein
MFVAHSLLNNKVCVTLVALPFTLLKKYLKAKGELAKPKYFTMQKNIIFKKNPLKETKILQNIRTLELISSFNTSQNIIFPKTLI